MNCESSNDTGPTAQSLQDSTVSTDIDIDVAEHLTDEGDVHKNLSPEEIANIFLENVDDRKDARERELFEFLDELLNSDEYKNRKEVADASTQVIPRYLQEFRREVQEYMRSQIVVDYPLSKYSREKFENKLFEEAKEKCRENRLILEKQKRSIAVIRDKLNETRNRPACPKLERLEKTKRRLSKIIEKYKLQSSKRYQIAEKVISMKRIRHHQTIGRQERMQRILAKLVQEDRRIRQIKAVQNKTYDYKVTRRERVISDIAIEGRHIDLIYEDVCEEESVAEEEAVYAAFEDKAAEVQEKGKKTKKEKRGKKEKAKKEKKGKKDEKKDKQSKKAKSDKTGNKPKKDKKGKKGKKTETEDLVLPQIPLVNPRIKIHHNDPEYLRDLVLRNKQYDDFVFEADRQRKELLYTKPYEIDFFLHSCPNPIIFADIKNGNIYRKKIMLLNTSTIPKKVKLHSAKISNGLEFETIEVENFGIHNLVPGLSMSFSITLHPKNITHPIAGQITFLTWTNLSEYVKQFPVEVQCLSPVDEVIIEPAEINFGVLKYWRARNKTFEKKIQITNNSSSPCQIKIRKVLDAVGFEQSFESIFEYDGKTEWSDAEQLENVQPEDLSELRLNLPGYFTFPQYVLNLEPLEEIELPVHFGSIDYVGDYFEKFQFKIYQKNDGEFLIFDCKEIVLLGETTPYFINSEPEVLDFGMCSFNSVYQNKFRIFNTSNLPQRILISFPTNLKYYFSCNTPEIIIQGNYHQDVFVKFHPTGDILTNSNFYDPVTDILSFPVRASLVSKKDNDYPVLKVYVYAILSPNIGLVIKPIRTDYVQIYDGGFLINFGNVSTKETVYAKVGLTNYSPCVQHFGFFDLPKCVIISPNYGFGEIKPHESKILKIMLSPESTDFCHNPVNNIDKSLLFKVTVTTIKHLGAVKKDFDFKALRKSMERMENILRNSKGGYLELEMMDCVDALRNDDAFNVMLAMLRMTNLDEQTPAEDLTDLSLTPITEEPTTPNVTAIEGAYLTPDTLNTETTISKMTMLDYDNVTSNFLWISGAILDNHCYVSHQFVVFPNTPCGSYSVMSVDLKLKKQMHGEVRCCDPTKNKNVSEQSFGAHFEIMGSNDQITIEPNCGEIKNGHTIKLTLIAKPEIPNSIIEEKARFLRTQELMEKKRRQLVEKREKEKLERILREQERKQKKGKKDKNSSKSDKTSKKSKKETEKKGKRNERPEESKPKEGMEPPLPEIVINENDVVVTYYDMYPAEMVLWREFEPNAETEKLYIKVLCKVTMPDFVHNLDVHHVDFGPTILGDAKRKIFELRNIKNAGITPKLDKMSPIGSFTFPSVVEVPVPSEHILQLPISYFPGEPKKEIEYIEIISGSTVCPLILSGEGLEASLTFKPEFLVCRIEADTDSYSDFIVEIANQSGAVITLNFDKILELEGEMNEVPKPSEPGAAENDKKGKAKGKDKKARKEKGGPKSSGSSKKSKKGKEIKPVNKLNELSEDEIYSIENFFSKRKAVTYFEIVDGPKIQINDHSKKIVKLRFGIAPPPEQPAEKGKKTKRGDKDKKKNKVDKSSKGSGKSSKNAKGKKKKKGPADEKVYLAKFNVLLGNSTFLKDIIAVGKFT